MNRKNSQRKAEWAVILRVLADVVFVNLALFTAVALRLLVKVLWDHPDAATVHQLVDVFLAFYYAGVPLLTGLVIVVFHLFGIYTRTRFYARKHKAFILFQAVTLTYLLFVFSIYFLVRDVELIPRGIFVVSYLGTLLLSGGTRLLKHAARERYDIVNRRGPAGNGVGRVLVVGGAGYVGSVLARQLLGRGYHVRVLDAILFGEQSIADLKTDPCFELVEGDLRHVEAVVRAVKGCDAVVHLGGLVGDPSCDLDAESTREINTVATKLLVQVCRGYGAERLLLASTCAVYGASEDLTDERSNLNPVSLYAKSKADAEEVILATKVNGFCPVVLRIGTIFGHSYRPRFDLVVNLLVAKAKKEGKITIYNKNQWRPFVHVHDVARAFVLCLEANPEIVGGEVFNVGAYSLNLTLGQLAEKIKMLLPDTQIEYVENDDTRNYRVSFGKIHTHLGFSCERTIEDGIREVTDFLMKHPAEVISDEFFDNSKRIKQLYDSWLVSGSDIAVNRLIETWEAPKPAVD